MNPMRERLFGLIVAAVACAVARADENSIPAAPARTDPPRVFVSGVKDDFAKTRAAIAEAKQKTGRDYRVVVVDGVNGTRTPAACSRRSSNAGGRRPMPPTVGSIRPVT